jgi:hypothetical protein
MERIATVKSHTKAISIVNDLHSREGERIIFRMLGGMSIMHLCSPAGIRKQFRESRALVLGTAGRDYLLI